MAHGAPGEFAADALLRVAALDSLEAPRRIQLIEEAFQRAAEAQQPFKRRNAMRGISSNGGFQQRAFAQDLDALSLRTRAVEEMLPLDAAKARRLFLQIPPLNVPAVMCEDVLIVDVSTYYQTLTEIARRAFTAKELANGAAYQLVQQRLALISSPAEVEPAIRAAADSGLDDVQFGGAASAVTAAFKRIAGDDRSFTYYLPDTGAAVEFLAQEMGRRQLSSAPLAEAYRAYLVANFSAARCADDDAMEGGSVSTTGNALDARSVTAIRFFNGNLRNQLPAIETAEATPSSKSGAAVGQRSCQSSDCASIARMYTALVFDANGTAKPSKERESMEWQERFSDVLAALRDWQDGGGSAQEAAQQFREKCTFYTELASLTPDSHLQETTLRALLDYLQRSRDHAYARIEWLLPVNMLIGRMALDPHGLGRLGEDFVRSTDPVIAMYAQLEIAAPRSAPAVLSLM